MANRDASGSPTGWDSQMWGQVPPIQRDRIKRGNYLDCYCPHCEATLNDGDMAVFEVETAQGKGAKYEKRKQQQDDAKRPPTIDNT